LAAMLLPAWVSASDCIGLENMALKILKQENDRVHYFWNARVINNCPQTVSAAVQMQMVDEKGAELVISKQTLPSLFPNETREIRHEDSLPSGKFYNGRAFFFETTEIPASF